MSTSGAVPAPSHSYGSGAAGAAEHAPIRLYPVPHDLAAAMLTLRGQGMNSTFKAVKSVGLAARGDYVECLIVLIATYFTPTHHDSFSSTVSIICITAFTADGYLWVSLRPTSSLAWAARLQFLFLSFTED